MPITNASEEDEISSEVVLPPAKTPSPWPPVIAAIILMPVISYAMTQFVLIPKMRESLVKSAVEGVPLPGNAKVVAGKYSVSEGKPTGKNDNTPMSYEYPFGDIVVNLSGTKGTRYLKTSFTLFSSNPELKGIIARHRSELLNLTLNILSSKTLVDLETSGSKNMLLGELTENFNQVLKSNVVEQIYFTEFVVQ
jgi:flagellar FliL protein